MVSVVVVPRYRGQCTTAVHGKAARIHPAVPKGWAGHALGQWTRWRAVFGCTCHWVRWAAGSGAVTDQQYDLSCYGTIPRRMQQ